MKSSLKKCYIFYLMVNVGFVKKFTAVQKILLFLFSFIIICSFPAVNASQVFLKNNPDKVGIGEEVLVTISLDTQNEQINAIEGEVLFPSELLSISQVYTGSSIVTFWLDNPTNSITNSSVKFSGIIPGGYSGDNGFIFRLVFKANKVSTPEIKLESARVLKNDGKGTETQLNFNPLQLTINQSGEGVSRPKDTTPPERFTPVISRDNAIFNGKYFLVFAAQDKGAGIDYYEVKEGGNSYEKAESPYLLKDQSLKNRILVKAVDKNGNERVEEILPQSLRNNIILFTFAFIGIFVALVSFIVLKRLRSRRK